MIKTEPSSISGLYYLKYDNMYGLMFPGRYREPKYYIRDVQKGKEWGLIKFDTIIAMSIRLTSIIRKPAVTELIPLRVYSSNFIFII